MRARSVRGNGEICLLLELCLVGNKGAMRCVP